MKFYTFLFKPPDFTIVLGQMSIHMLIAALLHQDARSPASSITAGRVFSSEFAISAILFF